MSAIIAFAGPSLPAAERKRFKGVRFEPPARQGDVWRALERAPQVIALIDGIFESAPSVWHHEIRSALASGVAVFGAASMGALRAVELSPLGMIGIGEVYRDYASGRWNDDAAVALLHARAEHGFRALTVPLVTVDDALRKALAAKVITPAAVRALWPMAQAMHFHDRTWPRLYAQATWPAALTAAFERWRRAKYVDIKSRDAAECLDTALAFARSGAVAPRVPARSFSSRVRAQRLLDTQGDALKASWESASGFEEANAGLRTLLLAGWAQGLGLTVPHDSVVAWERRLAQAVADAGERTRLAGVFALEEWVLQNAHQMWADGPRRIEGLALEKVRQRVKAKRRERR